MGRVKFNDCALDLSRIDDVACQASLDERGGNARTNVDLRAEYTGREATEAAGF